MKGTEAVDFLRRNGVQPRMAHSAGPPLGAAEVGILATVGHTRAAVYRRPVVAVLPFAGNIITHDIQVHPLALLHPRSVKSRAERAAIAAAEAKGVALNYEAAVAGGIPIVKALREGLGALSIGRVPHTAGVLARGARIRA